MSNTDKLVEDWLLDKFIKGETYPRYHPVDHGEPDELKILSSDADWECNCYSDYTRDDQFEVWGTVETKSGAVAFRYGKWSDFPDFIEELYDYQNNSVCKYEEDEYSN